MTVRTRLNLHRKLDDVLGSESADALMAHLPPGGWSEVATKRDLDVLRTELRADFVDATNRQIKWLVTFAAAWSSLLITVVRFLP